MVSCVEHTHLLGHGGNHGHVVGNQQNRRMLLTDQAAEHVQDLGLQGKRPKPEVGSSATSNLGFITRPMAIMTRWHIPPLKWKGYWPMT